MNRVLRNIVLTMGFFLILMPAVAQFDPAKVARIEDDRLIFTISLKWSEEEKKELSQLFDLDSLLIAKVYGGLTAIEADGESWKVVIKGAGMVELSKPLQSGSAPEIPPADLFLLIDDWMNFGGEAAETDVIFGVNNLELRNAFVYTGTHAQFYLPGFTGARNVFISGTFNSWSTTGTPMRKAGKGWMTDLKLAPGKYAYKYIIDGRWTLDPVNKLTERGVTGSRNSVLYCYNHTFNLDGYKNARSVVVTGNFNGWNPRGLAMEPTEAGWALKAYLRDGTYAYKFRVDGKWMTDPENPSVREDASGNRNSFLEIGEPYLFTLEGFPDARKVILAGSFNHWDPNELVMEKSATGWRLPYVTPAGNYEYKFIVDGQWMPDPANPFSTGSGKFENSFIALKANHIFELKNYANAREIIVTGSFNGWRTDGYRMAKEGDVWKLPLSLKPGKYTYKFILDGTWILDPANPLVDENNYGTGNSVLWINPAD